MADLRRGVHEYQTFSAIGRDRFWQDCQRPSHRGELGVSTIVILHLERLLKQWRQEIMDKLGLEASQIGLIQQDKCVYEGKPITLAMGPSLVSRRYDPMMYEYFGLQGC